jgi:thiamine pyrophosphate-dependent acetolactate synthase large subunit-like protein
MWFYRKESKTKVQKSFGAKGVKVRRAEEFAPLLKKALECRGIWIFDGVQLF